MSTIEFLICRANYEWRSESKTTPPCPNAYPFEYIDKKDPGVGVAQWAIKFDTLQDLYDFKKECEDALIIDFGNSEYTYTSTGAVAIGKQMPLIKIYDDYVE